MWDEAGKGDGEGGVRDQAVQAWRPCTHQRYSSAISPLAAIEVRESPDLRMAEVLALCFSVKADEGQSASGMRGIFSAVRALEDCAVPPLVGASHRRFAGGGAKLGAQDYATPEMLRHLWQRANTEGDHAFVALVFLTWICFWRVGEAASVCSFDVLEEGGGIFSPHEVRWPQRLAQAASIQVSHVMGWLLVRLLPRTEAPPGQGNLPPGEAVRGDWLATHLRGSR